MRMIPRTVPSDCKSPGEVDFFNRASACKDIKDWVVIHSLHIAHHKTRVMGEIDFLVIVPNLGVLAVEIKAHQYINVKDGIWYMGRKDRNGTQKSPFVQINDSLFSLKEYIKSKNNLLSKIPFFPLVIFTDFEFNHSSIEWKNSQFISKKEYRSNQLEKLIEKRIRTFRQEKMAVPSSRWLVTEDKPNSDEIRLLIDLLRPNVEPTSKELNLGSRINNQIKKFTLEQCNALDNIEDNTAIIFDGAAGTGKTSLAIEAAIRNSQSGKSVLLILFNNLISQFVRYRLREIKNIKVCTINSLLLEHSKLEISDSKDFWNSELPDAALLSILNNEPEKFDVLIIDEAQDIVGKEYWLDPLEYLLKNGFSEGNFKLFGDFTFQSIYSFNKSKEDLLFLIKSKVSQLANYRLNTNCRNVRETINFGFIFSTKEVPYSRFRRESDKGYDCKRYIYKDDNEQIAFLKKLISEYLNYGFNASDIVILSICGVSDSIANKNSKALNLKEFELHNRTGVTFSSVHKFKGLEAPCIIITDCDELKNEHIRNVLITGISRSTDSVQLLISDNANSELKEIMKAL